ncbi:MAG: phytanoyl-CoA dioxygenase family protein [Pseudomonadota bacterium]
MLSADQRAEFEKTGVLVVENIVPERILSSIRHEYSDLLDELCEGWGITGSGFEDKLIKAYLAGHDWFQPMDISLPGDEIEPDTPMHHGPAVFDLLTCEGIVDVVESLIGPEITSTPIQHVRIKPPAPNLSDDEVRAHITATDWHQDRAVGHEEADQTDMVTVWVAITDATLENGCLQVQPGRPDGIMPHCPQRQTAIAPGFIDESNARPLPVKAGGAVIFHPLTPHASRVNHSPGCRWSFDLRYNVTGQPTGRDHFPDFVVRSRQSPDTELKDWRIWRQMWQDARARLSKAPHIPIHRWQSDAPYCA